MLRGYKVLIVLLAMILISVLAWYLLKENSVQFTPVFSFKTGEDQRNSDRIWWNLQENPSSEAGYSYLKEFYYSSTGKNLDDIITMDFDNYAYIICEGYVLEELSYNNLLVWGRFSGTPEYYGKVKLSESCDRDAVNVYQMRKGRYITPDIHNWKDHSRIVIIDQ